MSAVALFKRTSTDRQDTENQDDVLNSHVARFGHQVVKTISLPDVSGSKEHPRHLAALEEIIADIKAGLYTTVIVRDASRLDRRSRNHAELFRLRVWEAGGTIESAREEHYGKDDLTGDILTAQAQRAHHEFVEKLAADVRDANAKIDAKGGFRGGRAPWGYRSMCGICHKPRCFEPAHRGNKRLELDPDAAPIVRECFQMISNGFTTTQVVAAMEARGIRKTNSSIAGTIRRAVYRSGIYQVRDYQGVIRQHKTVPLVSADLWRSANASLSSRPAANRHRPRRPRLDDWSGCLRCGICTGVCYRNYTSGKMLPSGERERRRVYRCDSCQLQWDADRADAQVEALMAGDAAPEYVVVTVAPVQVRAERLEQVAELLRELPARSLPEAEEDRLRDALRAERRELQAMPADEEVRHEIRHTGRSRGDAWSALGSHLEKVAALRTEPFVLKLTGKGMGVEVVREFVPTVVSVPTDRPSLIFGTIPNYPPEQE